MLDETNRSFIIYPLENTRLDKEKAKQIYILIIYHKEIKNEIQAWIQGNVQD